MRNHALTKKRESVRMSSKEESVRNHATMTIATTNGDQHGGWLLTTMLTLNNKKSLRTINRVHETINKRVSGERPPKRVYGPT